jgi:uncharacterized integral membrane protein (TIGR00697 family)
MHEKFFESTLSRAQPNYLWFLTLTYAMVIIFANWFDSRLINIFWLNTYAGTLIFPFTFLLSDLITEVYGFKYARRAIWCGFLFNMLFIIYGQIVIHMPSPNYPTNNAMFDMLLKKNMRIILASGIGYLISEPLNSIIMAKLKIKMNGHYLGIRFVLSTIVAAGTDSLFFGLIAFYGMMSDVRLFLLIISMWIIKVFIEILALPISIRLTKNLKKIEQLDIYDKRTNFTIFSVDTHYTEKDNEFLKA